MPIVRGDRPLKVDLLYLRARIGKVREQIEAETNRHQAAINALEKELTELEMVERVFTTLSTAALDDGSSDHDQSAASDTGSQTEDAEANENNRSAAP